MPTLMVHAVPEDVVRRLHRTARRNRRSLEQEVRELLRRRFPLREVS